MLGTRRLGRVYKQWAAEEAGTREIFYYPSASLHYLLLTSGCREYVHPITRILGNNNGLKRSNITAT